MKIAEKVKEFFHNEGIHSTTIQPEFVEMNEVGVLSIFRFLLSPAICFINSIIIQQVFFILV